MSTTQKRLGKRPWLNQGEAKAIYEDDGVWIVTGYNPDLVSDLKILPPYVRQFDDQSKAWWFDSLWEKGVLELVQPYYPDIEIVKHTRRAIDVPPRREPVRAKIAPPDPPLQPRTSPTGKVTMPLAQAKAMAEQLRDNLSPYCERIMVAGSIRRGKPTIGDIELVCIPKSIVTQGDLFALPVGQGPNQLDQALDSLVAQQILIRGNKQGPAHKKFHNNTTDPARRIQLNLFMTTPEKWPVILAIRTGSSRFSQQLVVPQNQKTRDGLSGLLKPGYRIGQEYRGRLWHARTGKLVRLTSERQLFDNYILGGWREPERRH